MVDTRAVVGTQVVVDTRAVGTRVVGTQAAAAGDTQAVLVPGEPQATVLQVVVMLVAAIHLDLVYRQ